MTVKYIDTAEDLMRDHEQRLQKQERRYVTPWIPDLENRIERLEGFHNVRAQPVTTDDMITEVAVEELPDYPAEGSVYYLLDSDTPWVYDENQWREYDPNEGWLTAWGPRNG